MTVEFSKAPFLLKLMSISVSAAETAGKLIHEVVKKGELNIVNKGSLQDYDPQTEADRLAQLCIVGKLKECFPNMKVIAEEGELKGTIQKYILADIIPNDAVLKVICPSEYYNLDEHNVIVWVDPLDGTTGFSKGILHQALVSIGIATAKGRPIAGVLHQPFCCSLPIEYSEANVDYSKAYQKTVWGILGAGIVGLESRIRYRKSNVVALVSTNHHSEKDRQASLALGADMILHASGAAYKGLCVLEGEADVLLYFSAGTKRWDTCALEVFFRIMDGQLTDKYGNEYDYGVETEYENNLGVIASLTNHSVYVKRIQQFLSSN